MAPSRGLTDAPLAAAHAHAHAHVAPSSAHGSTLGIDPRLPAATRCLGPEVCLNQLVD